MLSKRKYRLGEISTWSIILVLAVFAAAILMYAFYVNFSNTNKTIALLSDKVKFCDSAARNRLGDEFDRAVHDGDSDGIIDECDICVVIISQEAYASTKRGEERLYVSSKNTIDNDNDGIPDACDSSSKKAKPHLGFIGDAVAIECKRSAPSYGLLPDVSDIKGYTTCHLT